MPQNLNGVRELAMAFPQEDAEKPVRRAAGILTRTPSVVGRGEAVAAGRLWNKVRRASSQVGLSIHALSNYL